jgi:high-affinity iron transporter
VTELIIFSLSQVWFGVGLGLLICIVIGSGMVGAFYGLSSTVFARTELIWEGVFALIASLIITMMGAALLRISKLKEKWTVKIGKALEKPDPGTIAQKHPLGRRFKRWSEKYAMFLLPFVTVLREGLEAVVFIGGVGVGMPASAFPLAVICGLLAGSVVGYLIYK